ncbi:MAG: hypothetical protein ACLQLO_27325, partial [Mycobacterium sp.]
PAGIASCIGATWIGGGVPGTVQLLRHSLQPGGMMLIGEPYWRQEPPDQATVEGCLRPARSGLSGNARRRAYPWRQPASPAAVGGRPRASAG